MSWETESRSQWRPSERSAQLQSYRTGDFEPNLCIPVWRYPFKLCVGVTLLGPSYISPEPLDRFLIDLRIHNFDFSFQGISFWKSIYSNHPNRNLDWEYVFFEFVFLLAFRCNYEELKLGKTSASVSYNWHTERRKRKGKIFINDVLDVGSFLRSKPFEWHTHTHTKN